MLIIFSATNVTYTTAIAMKLTFFIVVKHGTFQTTILAKLNTTISTLRLLVLYGFTFVAGYLDHSKPVYFMTGIGFVVTNSTGPRCVTLGTEDLAVSAVVVTFNFSHCICMQKRRYFNQ